MRPFLAMLSMSSMLVEPLHLQAMVGEEVGGGLGLKASRRSLSVNHSALRNSEVITSIFTHSHGNVTCRNLLGLCPACFLLTATTPPVGLSPTMAVGQPTRQRYQRPLQPHQTIPGDFYLTGPPAAIPTGNVHILVASLVLVGCTRSFHSILSL